jgi:peroxiredoxin
MQSQGVALTVALVSEGTAEENRSKRETYALSRVLLQQKREVAETYEVWGTPGAVLIRSDGRIGSSVAQGSEAIRALVAQAVGARLRLLPTAESAGTVQYNGRGQIRPAPIEVGDPIPPLKFRDLEENVISLMDFRGRETLLLFWNPSCGFCQKMLNDLHSREADFPSTAPQLVVISSGTVEVNRAMGLRSKVVLDEGLQAMSVFGAAGTPTAVLLDANGHVASKIATGAEAVMALAGFTAMAPRASSRARV